MTAFPMPSRRSTVRASLLLVLAAAVALATLPRLMGEAQTANLELVASNWSGGGGRLESGNLALESSIGQHSAGVLQSGTLRLEVGFQHSQLVLDVNCDDRVTSTDPLFALQVLTGLAEQGNCSVDANRSGSLTVADPLHIRRKLAGLP